MGKNKTPVCEISCKIVKHSKQGANQQPTITIKDIIKQKEQQSKNNKE